MTLAQCPMRIIRLAGVATVKDAELARKRALTAARQRAWYARQQRKEGKQRG